MLILYNALLAAGVAFGFPVLLPLMLASEKRRRSVWHRLGMRPIVYFRKPSSFSRPPIWVHALSVGEVLSAVPLVRELRAVYKEHPIVFSASTQTGHEVAAQALDGQIDALAYFPFDFPLTVKLMAQRIEPALVLVVESDLWPNFLSEMRKRRIPVFLLNARLSQRSFAGFRRFPSLARPIFTSFTRICAQTVEDAGRFRMLGAAGEGVVVTGNLKFDQVNGRMEKGAVENLKADLGIRPEQKIMVAGSTHPGEEEILADAYAGLKRLFPGFLLIIAPRDHRRAGEVARIFEAHGARAAMLTGEREGRPVFREPDVVVVDVVGRLRQLYALAQIALVGGSLVPCGGHNPLEPAAFGKPVLFGPHMSDFAQVSAMLLEGGGALQVSGAGEIRRTVGRLLENLPQARSMGGRAADILHSHKGAVARTLAVIQGVCPA